MWDETEETRNGIDVESVEQGFGEPRFDGVWAALFITDECVVAFGDARLVAEEIGRGGKDMLCNVYLLGRLAEQFKMRRKIFNRIFTQGWDEIGKSNGEKNMANFNEKINSHEGFFLFDQESKYLIARVGLMRLFERMFERKMYDDLYLPTNTYRLFIQYKTTHRVKNLAGRCFLWDNTDGRHMKDPGKGVELRSMKDASKDDCEGFGNPRFDGIDAAIFISKRYVSMYGDVRIEADDITQDKKHVICTMSLCGSIVSSFRIPAEVFDRYFGLKENFPEQDEKQVEEENDLIKEARRNIESCKNSLITNKYRLEKAVHLIQGALEDFDVKWHKLDDMLYKLTQTEERR